MNIFYLPDTNDKVLNLLSELASDFIIRDPRTKNCLFSLPILPLLFFQQTFLLASFTFFDAEISVFRLEISQSIASLCTRARWISMRPWNSKNASVKRCVLFPPANFLVIFLARPRVPLIVRRQSLEFEPRTSFINSFFQSSYVQFVSRLTFCFSNNFISSYRYAWANFSTLSPK